MDRKIFFLLCFLIFHSTLYPQQTEKQLTFSFSQLVGPDLDGRERAVAFHSITFIDSLGLPLEKITMGTELSNTLQDGGWYRNESLPHPGLFQWAGRNGHQAAIRLSMPEETAGLLLYLQAAQDSIWMEVALDGQPLASRRVDKYWHSAYVPLKTPSEALPPVETLEWEAGRLYPKFPQGDILYGFGIRMPLADWGHGAVRLNWRANHSFDAMMCLTVASMQGLVNRHGSRVYVEWFDPPWFDGQFKTNEGKRWRELLEESPGIDAFFEMDGLSTVSFLYHHFAGHFNGAVVYDPELPETINLATMIAGLENRVMLAPEQLQMPGMPSFEDVYDLRPLAQQQGWNNSDAGRVAIYQWAYDNLWPELDKHLIGIMSPGPPSYRPFNQEGDAYYQLSLVERDLFIAAQSPVLWLSPVDEADTLLLEPFVEESHQPPIFTGVMWNHEHKMVDFIARRGGWVAGFSWPGVYSSANLSVWGSFPEAGPYTAEVRPEAIWATFGEGPVIQLHSSDGDALFYQMQKGFPQFQWDMSHRQHFGWTINPSLFDLAPPVWNHYNKQREDASLISGLAGVSYTYPARMSPEQLDTYLDFTADYFGKTGLRVVHQANFVGFEQWVQDYRRISRTYYDKLNEVGYLGMISDEILRPWNMDFDPAGSPAPIGWGRYRLTGTNTQELIGELKKKGSPDILHVEAEDPGMPHTVQVIEDSDAEGGAALFAPTDHGVGWILWPGDINLLPGDYQLTYRMKVEDNTSNTPLVSIRVIEESTSWDYTFRQLAAADFDEPGQYQEFSVSFTLDTFTNSLATFLDYDNPYTPLYIDYLKIERTTPSHLPHFVTGLIDNFILGSDGLPDAVDRFELAFAREGGVVLRPEEWFAALNPEYMLEFAIPYLGEGYPALELAQSEMSTGKYMRALLTIRTALREQMPLTVFPADNSPLPCHGDETGLIVVQAFGGEPPYTYEWNTPLEQDSIAENLPAGTYTITVTDASGTSTTASITIDEPPPLEIEAQVIAGISCQPDGGQAIATLSGGNPEFQYTYWDNGFLRTVEEAYWHQFNEGAHQAEVVDWRWCRDTTFFEVLSALPLEIAIRTTPASGQQANGTTAVEASGGVPPYTYFWNTEPPQQTAEISGLASGAYTVTVLDAQGCEATMSADVLNAQSEVENLLAFDLFPNPATREAFFEMQLESPQAIRVILSDIHGRELKAWRREKAVTWKETIGCSQLEKGVYVIRADIGGRQVSRRLVVY